MGRSLNHRERCHSSQTRIFVPVRRDARQIFHRYRAEWELLTLDNDQPRDNVPHCRMQHWEIPQVYVFREVLVDKIDRVPDQTAGESFQRRFSWLTQSIVWRSDHEPVDWISYWHRWMSRVDRGYRERTFEDSSEKCHNFLISQFFSKQKRLSGSLKCSLPAYLEIIVKHSAVLVQLLFC